MINVSDTFVRVMNSDTYSNNTTKLLLIFDQGSQPTEQDVNDIKDMSEDNSLTVENLITWALNRGDTLLNFNAYGNDMKPRFPNNKFVQWPLSESQELFRQVNEGTPTWFAFLVMDRDIGTAGNITYTDLQSMTTQSELSHFGTVGDEESEADMKLLGGYVDDREYSTTDLEFSFA